MEKQTIALAGVGDFGRYLYEVIEGDDRYDLVVLSRQKSKSFCRPELIYVTDYSEESVFSILQSTQATTLISTVHCPNDTFIAIHQNFLNACLRSSKCKRFIPSEFSGDIERYPDMPGGYGKSRLPFRSVLAQSIGVEWTLFNLGWFMDYILPQEKSYIHHVPGEFPIDWDSWHYTVRGTGDEPQSWTCARDAAKAVAELLAASEWEEVVYVAGQFGTFNEVAGLMEGIYGRTFTRTFRTSQDIRNKPTEDRPQGGYLATAEAEEVTICSVNCCPKEKTLRQRQKYFSNIKFLTIVDMLKKAETVDKI